MSTLRSLGVVVIVVVVALCAFFSRSAHRHADAARNPGTHIELAATPHHADGDLDAPDEDTEEVDLLGNGVTDAVARYRLDATGSLYEVHSPQTEIPKLGSPKS